MVAIGIEFWEGDGVDVFNISYSDWRTFNLDMIAVAHSNGLAWAGRNAGVMQSDSFYAAAADFAVASECIYWGWCGSFWRFKAGG